MQTYSASPGRSPMKAASIESKVSVPAGKVPAPAVPNEPQVKPAGGAVKGFSGGLIDPKCH